MNKESYVNSIYNFKYNWISKCGLILNPKSEIFINSIENENKADITYLVSHGLEDKLLNNDELVYRNKIFFDKDKNNIIDCDKEDNIYWIIRQIFNKKYKSFNKNNKIRTKKEIIFNTLKYLYFTKTVEIKHKLES